MMDFARSLALPRETDATRAVPVLSSRFEGTAPASDVFAGEVSAEETAHATPTEARGFVELAGASTAVGMTEVRIDAPDKSVGERRAVDGPPVVEVASGAVAMPSRGVPRTAVVPAISTGPHDRTNALASMPIADRSAPASVSVVDRPAPASVSVVDRPAPASIIIPDRSASRLRALPQRPLSEAAMVGLDAHDEGRPEARPAVHVTIDRIEVRAPAAPASVPQPTRPRPSAPSVPLGDYLRQRGPSRGGIR